MPYTTGNRHRVSFYRGATSTPRGLLKPCPQCPAEVGRSCLRWVGERFQEWKNGQMVTHASGRWDRMAKPHPGRTATAANKKFAAFLDPDRQRACTDASRHRGHDHGENAELYCRGRL